MSYKMQVVAVTNILVVNSVQQAIMQVFIALRNLRSM